MSRRFTALCACGRRRPIRADGNIGGHAVGQTDDCEGGPPIKGTERCAVCQKFRYDRTPGNPSTPILEIRHKLDCRQRLEQP